MKRVVVAFGLALSSLSVAHVADAGDAGGKAVPKSMTRGELPADFAVGSAAPSLALQVEIADGKVVSYAPAGDGTGNLRATRSGEGGETMLTVSSDLPVALKFDLYISADGERFTYTSTCGLTPGISSFEMWKQPVRVFALGNPRVMTGRMVCD